MCNDDKVTTATTPVVICLGSNAANKKEEMAMAADWLSTVIADMSYSGAYETEATPESRTPMPYLNAVATGLTSLPCIELKHTLKSYETQRGRHSLRPEEGTLIDLDIVFYGTDNLRPAESQSEYFLKGYRSLTAGTAPDAER